MSPNKIYQIVNQYIVDSGGGDAALRKPEKPSHKSVRTSKVNLQRSQLNRYSATTVLHMSFCFIIYFCLN